MTRAIFPGTFDPIHYGHINIAKRAARIFDEIVIAVFDKPIKSLLFSPETRIELAQRAFAEADKISVMGYNSLTVDLCKKINAQIIVRGLRVFSDFEYEFRMALANQRLAPDLDMIAFMTHEEYTFLSTRLCRNAIESWLNLDILLPSV
jgi:pantetheine-phosphate adenylyltransferase